MEGQEQSRMTDPVPSKGTCPKCGEGYTPSPVHVCLGQRPSKELTPISEVIGELKHDIANADAGPWEIYTSNSYRRVGLAGTYKAVVYPVVHKDGQPDIAGFENLRAMVESFNAAPRLIAEVERLQRALQGISTCSTCEACRGAATRALGGEPSTAWRPIETAPVEMDPILMADGKWFAAGHVHQDGDIRKFSIYHFAVSQEYDWTPTHWMPLPAWPSQPPRDGQQ